MLKEKSSPQSSVKQNTPKPVAASVSVAASHNPQRVDKEDIIQGELKLKNSDLLSNLDEKLVHLPMREKKKLEKLLKEFAILFPDTPGKTTAIMHDVDVSNASPCKQHPYRMNPSKLKNLSEEIEYMLHNDIIEPSSSEWSSPCVLVPKPDGSYRFCTDFRRLNAVTVTDSYPIPRIDDCIDRIGPAKFVSKLDLLKGYWQVPLTERARRLSAFVTPQGLYQYKVMPFGMKNAPATFHKLINQLLQNLDGCEGYIDDVIVYSDTWEEHMLRLRVLFTKLAAANLTVNLKKSEFGHARVTYLGYVVGQGQVKPVTSKVEAIHSFQVPANKKELMRFLGMARYYRKFCRNFSVVTAPLTNLLRKHQPYVWSPVCQQAFENVKAILYSDPILAAPDFGKQFKLVVDASDVGAGSVLHQEDSQGIDHPVCYFSAKFDEHIF